MIVIKLVAAVMIIALHKIFDEVGDTFSWAELSSAKLLLWVLDWDTSCHWPWAQHHLTLKEIQVESRGAWQEALAMDDWDHDFPEETSEQVKMVQEWMSKNWHRGPIPKWRLDWFYDDTVWVEFMKLDEMFRKEERHE